MATAAEAGPLAEENEFPSFPLPSYRLFCGLSCLVLSFTSSWILGIDYQVVCSFFHGCTLSR